jgi:hypothetical protein
MRTPRHLLGGPGKPPRPTHVPLPGYLCEQCQDAPAVQWQPVPEGGEIGVCEDCSKTEGAAIMPKRLPEPYEG